MPDNAFLWLRGGVFFALLLAASVADVKYRIIPDSICAAIALTGLYPFEPYRLSGIFCALPMFIAACLFGGMGGGDIKLMAAAGAVLGVGGGFAALFIGLSAMLLAHAIWCAVPRQHGRKRPKSYPIVPFLSAGCVAAYIIIQTGGISNI